MAAAPGDADGGEQRGLLQPSPTFTERGGGLLGALFSGAAGGAAARTAAATSTSAPSPGRAFVQYGAAGGPAAVLRVAAGAVPTREQLVERVFGTSAAPAQRVAESLDYEPVQNLVFYRRMKAAKEQKHLFG